MSDDRSAAMSHAVLTLFPAAYLEPVDTTTLIERLPGTADAACICGHDRCLFPFCDWKENP